MNFFKKLENLFTPISYPSVKQIIEASELDLEKITKSTKGILNTKGKVAAIIHLRELISPSPALPPAKRFVDALTK